jgi:hypothetical protein
MREDENLAWLRDQVDEALADAEPVESAGPTAFAGAISLVIFLITLWQM